MFSPSVWEGTPGLMSNSWVNNHSKTTEYSYRFGTGIYYESAGLLLVEDIFEWAHRRIESKQVRSAFDIILAINKGELIL